MNETLFRLLIAFGLSIAATVIICILCVIVVYLFKTLGVLCAGILMLWIISFSAFAEFMLKD